MQALKQALIPIDFWHAEMVTEVYYGRWFFSWVKLSFLVFLTKLQGISWFKSFFLKEAYYSRQW